MSLRSIIFEKRQETEADKNAATTPFVVGKPRIPSEEQNKAAQAFIDKVNQDRANEDLEPIGLD